MVIYCKVAMMIDVEVIGTVLLNSMKGIKDIVSGLCVWAKRMCISNR